MSTELTIDVKAFSGEKYKKHQCRVEDDGTIRVFDPVADYYTLCHNISSGDQGRIRRKALSLVKSVPRSCFEIQVGDRLKSYLEEGPVISVERSRSGVKVKFQSYQVACLSGLVFTVER